MSAAVFAIAARLHELESDLVTAWLKRPEVRRGWHVTPDELTSPHARLLLTAGLELLDTHTGDLCSAVQCGGKRREIAKLFGSAPRFSLEYVADVPATVRNASGLRTALALHEGATRALARLSVDADVGEVANELRDAIAGAEQATRKRGYSEGDLFRLVHEKVSSREPPGMTTGFPGLDDMTGGLRAGDVWAFGAPTNWGKTSFLLAIVDRWLRYHRKPVLIVTCEDSPTKLATRLAARRLGIKGTSLRDNRLTDEERTAIVGEWQSGGRTEVMLDGRGVDVMDIATSIRASIQTDGVGLVLVDYLQCIESNRHPTDRRANINHIGRTLTNAIKTSGAAGILASQITDENLRESRDLENAAEVVVIGRQAGDGSRTLFLKKNKDGHRFIELDMAWDNHTASFENMTDGEKVAAEMTWDSPLV